MCTYDVCTPMRDADRCTGVRVCRDAACAGRAACIIQTNGLNIEARIYIHTLAHGSAGCGGRADWRAGARCVKVLKGYSKKGTHKGYSRSTERPPWRAFV